MRLVDSHCHLDAAEFDGDRSAVVQRARAAGVQRQVIPAVDAAGWPKLGDICAADSGLFPAYGLHPIAVPVHRQEHLALLRERIECERPVAIGECGLDFFIEELDPRGYEINSFMVNHYPSESWNDVPGNMHINAGIISFADGHAIIWPFSDPRTYRQPTIAMNTPGDPDLRQIQTWYGAGPFPPGVVQ